MDKKFILKAALVAIVSFYFIVLQYKDNGSYKNMSSTSDTSDMVLKKLNTELKTIHKIKELKTLKSKNDSHNLNFESELEQGYTGEDTSKYGLDSRGQDQFEEIYNDFNNKNPEKSMDIDDMISKRVNDKKWLDEYQNQKNKAYVKSFIENARLNGYQIVVDQDNEVKSVRKIKPKGYAPPNY